MNRTSPAEGRATETERKRSGPFSAVGGAVFRYAHKADSAVTHLVMLAPPPEAVESRDKTALDDAGRQRYLDSLGVSSYNHTRRKIIVTLPVSCARVVRYKSPPPPPPPPPLSPLPLPFHHLVIERRLSKLEGASSGRRNQLTSKDILQSLSEARDDHMQQRGTASSRNRPQSTSWSNSGSGTGRESPFSIRNEFADVDLSGGVSAVEEVERGRRERVVMEGGGEERPASGSSIWTCCFRCRGMG